MVGSPAFSQDEPVARFDGPYIGLTNLGFDTWDGRPDGFGLNFGYSAGVANYHFCTDGHYNSAPGQSFSVGMPMNELGAPFGLFFGRNWQDGRRVFGVEAYFHTGDARADNFNSPDYIHTGNHSYDIKPHWLTVLSATAGVALGRVMLYAQLGPAIGHPVAQIDDLDNNLRIWTPRAVPGISAGAGIQLAVTQSISIGVGYRAYALAPLHVTGPSIDRATGDPVPGTETDHTVQLSAHSITARIVYHYGHTDRAQSWVGQPFQWGGFYAGAYLGSLHQIGGQFGYDWRHGNMLVGASLQVGFNVCCGRVTDIELSGRVGRIFGGDILGYAEVTGAYQDGTFFGVVDGPYYGAGLGIEVPLSDRVSGFMEAKLLGAPGFGFGDVYIQGGLNLHFGHRR